MLTTVERMPPAVIPALEAATAEVHFGMPSDRPTGALLRTLAASKPGGALLELGTGTGLATAWLLDGMDRRATLVTVDNDAAMQAIARQHLGQDSRLTIHTGDGAAFLDAQVTAGALYDMLFADTWPGKFYHLEQALGLLRPGGLYVIDDMLPQPNWPEGHAPKAAALVESLMRRRDLHAASLAWGTGIMIAVKQPG